MATNSSSSSTIGSLHSSIQRSSAAAARAYHGSSHTDMPHGTTVLCIHKDGQVRHSSCITFLALQLMCAAMPTGRLCHGETTSSFNHAAV